jgi:hypothetical protein
MAKKRKSKSKGLWALANIELWTDAPATLTLDFKSVDVLRQFLRAVTDDTRYPWTAEDDDSLSKWTGLVLLLPNVNGRPRKNTHPLWDAFQEAKAEDPLLGRREFLVHHCNVKRGNETAIRKWMSQLRREERMALDEEH